VYLTFDDGPHPINTPRILAILEGYRALATFFVVGAYAENYPDLLRRMVAAGHTIGSHLYSHRSVKGMACREWKEEVIKTERIVSDATGRTPVLIRPPYGDVTIPFAWWILRKGRKIVLWSDDSRDSFLHDSEDLVAYVRELPLGGGSILLFHEDYAHTVKAMPVIVETILGRGGRFSSLE